MHTQLTAMYGSVKLFRLLRNFELFVIMSSFLGKKNCCEKKNQIANFTDDKTMRPTTKNSD
jgi:hypothetical protein